MFKATAALLLLASSSHAIPAGNPAVQLAGVQLRLLGNAASSFCTSFVGGVATKTSTVPVTVSTQVTKTNTITQSVAGPTATDTLTESFTATITPDAQTITSPVFETATVTVAAVDYASTCGVTQAPAAGGLQERGLFDVVQGNVNAVINAFARPVIASACSSYIIKTPTMTTTSTATQTGTLTVPATAFSTGDPSTITQTVSVTASETLLPETVTVFPTSTITSILTPCTTGLACNGGTCRCPSGQFRCPNVDKCVVPTIGCQQFNQRGRFGITNSGETADGNGFCTYGYAGANGGVVYCVYSPSTGALLSRQVDPNYNTEPCPGSVAPFTPACS